jgi:hypothetical protein
MAERMLTLTEAFRTILRASYPSRPALADEVDGRDYFRPPLDGSKRPVEEVQAVSDALDILKDAIANQSVRLHGRLDLAGERPADIYPTEITRAGISVFDNVLDVWQPTTRVSRFRQLPIYLNVHCYAADIMALIAPADDPEVSTAVLSVDQGEVREVAKPAGFRTNKQAALKAKCATWIAALPEQPARRKPDVRADAIKAIQGLSGRQFDAAWDDAAPDAWKQPGPK